MEPSSIEIRPVDTVAPSHGVTAVFHCLTENVPWETLWNCFCNCKRDKGQTTLASAGPRENGRLADKSTHSSEVQPYVMNAIQSSTRARSWSTSIGMNSNSFPIVRRGKGCPPSRRHQTRHGRLLRGCLCGPRTPHYQTNKPFSLWEVRLPLEHS